MKTTYVFRDGKLAAKSRTDHRDRVSGPYVISDGMDSIRSMADGKVYDSRSAYYSSLRGQGYEVVGDDSAFRDGNKPNIEMDSPINDIKRAMGR